MTFCIWYAWPVLASGERFFEMICSCVKNCEAIIRTTSVTRIAIAASVAGVDGVDERLVQGGDAEELGVVELHR